MPGNFYLRSALTPLAGSIGHAAGLNDFLFEIAEIKAPSRPVDKLAYCAIFE